MKKFIKNIIIFTLVLGGLFINVKAIEVESDLNEKIESREVVNRASLDLSTLTITLETAKNLDISEYTETSKNRINKAIEKAERIINGLDQVDQSEVDQAETELFKAMKYTDVDEFKNIKDLLTEANYLFDESNKYGLTVFTKQSLSNLKVQIVEAQVFLDSTSESLEDAKRVYQSLKTAYNNLETTGAMESSQNLKSNLEDLFKQVGNLDAYDYSKESFALMNQASASARVVVSNQNSSRHMLDVCKSALDASINNLVKLKVNNKVKLENLVADIEALDLSLYLADNQAALKKSLKASQDLLAADDVEQEDFKLALDDLSSNKNKLVLKDSDNNSSDEAVVDESKPSQDETDVDTSDNNQGESVDTGIENNKALFVSIFIGGVVLLLALLYFSYKNKREK